LHRIASHRIALHRIALHCIALPETTNGLHTLQGPALMHHDDPARPSKYFYKALLTTTSSASDTCHLRGQQHVSALSLADAA